MQIKDPINQLGNEMFNFRRSVWLCFLVLWPVIGQNTLAVDGASENCVVPLVKMTEELPSVDDTVKPDRRAARRERLNQNAEVAIHIVPWYRGLMGSHVDFEGGNGKVYNNTLFLRPLKGAWDTREKLATKNDSPLFLDILMSSMGRFFTNPFKFQQNLSSFKSALTVNMNAGLYNLNLKPIKRYVLNATPEQRALLATYLDLHQAKADPKNHDLYVSGEKHGNHCARGACVALIDGAKLKIPFLFTQSPGLLNFYLWANHKIFRGKGLVKEARNVGPLGLSNLIGSLEEPAGIAGAALLPGLFTYYVSTHWIYPYFNPFWDFVGFIGVRQ